MAPLFDRSDTIAILIPIDATASQPTRSMSPHASRFVPRRAWIPAALLLGAVPVPAPASTNNFVVPSFRGQSDSEIGFWERFTVPYGAPGNAADQPGSTSGALVTQTLSLSAFATGSGNLYDPSAPMAFRLADTVPYSLGTVVLQIRTLGSELAYDQVQLSYTDGTGPQALAPVVRQELDRGTILGASVSYLWQWDLQGLGATEYSLAFGTPDPSLSLDAITVDTWTGFQAVPEPSSIVLLLAGGVLLGGRRARSR